jgi:hypothetical protein
MCAANVVSTESMLTNLSMREAKVDVLALGPMTSWGR